MSRATESQGTAQQKDPEVKKEPQGMATPSGGRQSLSTRDHFASPFFGGAFPFMQRFSEEMDRLFEDFGFGGGLYKRGPWGQRGSTANWAPRVEAFERQGRFVVRAELPGVAKEDVNVELTDDSLTIQGDRRHEHEEKREGYYRSECSYGHFYRAIPLPEGVGAEGATAKFQDGVLEIEMPAPRRAETKSHRIEIQDGGRGNK